MRNHRSGLVVCAVACAAAGLLALILISHGTSGLQDSESGVDVDGRADQDHGPLLESDSGASPEFTGREVAYRLLTPDDQAVRLGGDDYLFVLESLRKEAAAEEKRLNRFYDQHVSGRRTGLSTARFEYDESGLLLAVELSHEYVERFRRGQYRVLFSNEGRVWPPSHVRELNVGCIHEGRGATAVIPVDLEAASIVEAVQRHRAKEHKWLAELTYQFNLKPLRERKQLADRRDSDPRWAKTNLPQGISIDKASMLASYNPMN